MLRLLLDQKIWLRIFGKGSLQKFVHSRQFLARLVWIPFFLVARFQGINPSIRLPVHVGHAPFVQQLGQGLTATVSLW